MLLNRKKVLMESKLVANAKLQHSFLQIQFTFYEKLSRSLTRDVLLAEEVHQPQFSVEISRDKVFSKIPNLSLHPGKSDSLFKDIKSKSVIWDLEQITEIVEGKISNILGDYYQEMDSYPIRTRTPSPPFMFVSRVTKMTAERGKLEPCMIEWEYDIPLDSFYAVHNALTGLIPFESSHAILLALAYIGCDIMFEGKLRCRALDSQIEILDELPPPGETIRGEVFIRQLINTKNNLLIQSEYNCYHKDRHLIMSKGTAGYFSEADLKNSRGLPAFAVPKEQTIVKRHFSPPLICSKTKFSDSEIQALQEGDFSTCFGDAYFTKKPLALASNQLLMINRILHVDPKGGLCRLGQIIGERDITPDHWIFEAHFKNDPVMPGVMLVEGCSQVIFFYMYYLGLHIKFENFKFIYSQNVRSTVKFRSEVRKEENKVQFRITVKEIDDSTAPCIITVSEIIHNNKVIGICDNLAVRLVSHT